MTDVNDNDPVCPSLPQLNLNRAVSVGTPVVTLRVTDADIGLNGEVIFQRIRGPFAPQFLEVNSQTGEIITVK